MCGNIFVSVCLSAFSCLGCRGATLSSESSRRRETGTSPGLEPVSLPSDLVELPFEVPRFLLEPRGWLTTTSLGMGVVSPSTQHIPTTVIPYGPSSATPGWLSGVSAVWPWGLSAVWPSGISAVWPSGLSPRGAASFVHARLGAKGYQGGMVSNPPSPCILNLLPVPPGCPRRVSR